MKRLSNEIKPLIFSFTKRRAYREKNLFSSIETGIEFIGFLILLQCLKSIDIKEIIIIFFKIKGKFGKIIGHT